MIPVDGQVLRKEDGESWCCCGLNLKEVQLERKQMCTFRDPSKIDDKNRFQDYGRNHGNGRRPMVPKGKNRK